MATSQTERANVYRPPFVLLFVGVFALGTLTATAFAAGFLAIGYESSAMMSRQFLRLLGIVYLWAVACSVLIVWAFTVRVTPLGIYGRTFWGNARFLSWESVITARAVGPAPFRFLRLFGDDGKAPLWMPLFLKGWGRLAEDILRHTGEEHPLRVHFED